MDMMENSMVKTKWYDKSWFFWVLMIFLPYIGVPFMWMRKREYSQAKKIILTIIFGLYAVGILLGGLNNTPGVAGDAEDEHIGEIEIPSDASTYIGKNYTYALEELETAGFENIKFIALGDLVTGWVTEEGEIENISINGEIEYEKGTWVNEDSEVVITYHSFPEEEIEWANQELEEIKFSMPINWEASVDNEQIFFLPNTETQGFFLYTPTKLETEIDSISVDVAKPVLEEYADEISKNNIFEFNSNLSEANGMNVVELNYEMLLDDVKYEVKEMAYLTDNYIHSFGAAFTVEETQKYNTALEQIFESVERGAKTIRVSFEQEKAKRAAVVALTNCYAWDVFADDGSTYDESKFHSYADTSGEIEKYYKEVIEKGTWTGKNENTWSVEGLMLQDFAFETIINASLDVTYENGIYVVSNVNGTLGNPGASKEFLSDISEIEPEGANLEKATYLRVPESLISEDRNQVAEDILDKSDVLDVYAAQKAFETYGELQFPYGFKCHWILDLRNQEQNRLDGSWTFKVGVTITNAFGEDLKGIAEGIVGGTTENPIIIEMYVY